MYQLSMSAHQNLGLPVSIHKVRNWGTGNQWTCVEGLVLSCMTGNIQELCGTQRNKGQFSSQHWTPVITTMHFLFLQLCALFATRVQRSHKTLPGKVKISLSLRVCLYCALHPWPCIKRFQFSVLAFLGAPTYPSHTILSINKIAYSSLTQYESTTFFPPLYLNVNFNGESVLTSNSSIVHAFV